jgi:CheY-like chemotaxis protein
VITDLHMPVMDGLQVIMELRHAHPGTKIIAMSGEPGSLDKARALRVQHTLAKPFHLPELLAIVRRLTTAPAAGLQPPAAASPPHLHTQA